jgi:hypothetical protein
MAHDAGPDYRDPFYLLAHFRYSFSLFNFVPSSS